MQRVFLTAEWRHLVMANYVVDPDILRPRVPAGTELDAWNGTTYVSLVGFRFLRTKLKGVPIPLHRDFEEINLRFYVRRRDGTGWKRGVVFIKEIVPRPAIALVARLVYNEPYVTMPTRHAISSTEATRVRYAWRHRGTWHHLAACAPSAPALPATDSEAHFITEHYWGYTAQRDGGTVEYEVQHPPWAVWTATDWSIDVDVTDLYGAAFASAMGGAPASVFIAEGSPVRVAHGRKLPREKR